MAGQGGRERADGGYGGDRRRKKEREREDEGIGHGTTRQPRTKAASEKNRVAERAGLCRSQNARTRKGGESTGWGRVRKRGECGQATVTQRFER